MIRAAVLMLVTAACLMGCNRQVTIHNVDSSPIVRYDGKDLSMEQVERAIVLGGRQLGWKMQPVGEGQMRGVLDLRNHHAVVDIRYDTSTYSITYKDSENLLFAYPNLIHRNYNNWILNLEQSINASLDAIPVE